ncbi:glycosyltransferase family 4 protein [Arenimonas alkanexedens]
MTRDLAEGATQSGGHRLLIVSTSYPRDAADWRGMFIRHLAFAMARQPGFDLALWSPPGEMPDNARYVPTADDARWLDELMEAGGISHLMRSGSIRALWAPATLLRKLYSAYRRPSPVDLYHVNWLQCAIPLPADGKPLLLTVLGNDLRLLRLPLVTRLVRRALRDRNVVICPNAEWMQAPLQDAFGDLADIRPVAFGIDPVWYDIQRRADDGPSRWLAVTRLTRDKLGPLFEWSEPLFRGRQRELHLFGPMQEPIDVPEWVHYHGPATAAQLSEDWFPRAHGVITLSRHAEGRPQLMLEAMAAGLPIIATRTPAHASLVQPGQTGALCDTPGDYAQALDQLEQADTNHRMGEAAREWIRAEVGTWDDCAGRYVGHYQRLLGEPRHD